MKETKTQKTTLNENLIYTYNSRYNKIYNYNDILYAPTLDDAYAKPSSTKKRIYNELTQQAHHNGADTYGVIGYNCNYFTFAYIVDNIIYIDTYANRYWAYIAD